VNLLVPRREFIVLDMALANTDELKVETLSSFEGGVTRVTVETAVNTAPFADTRLAQGVASSETAADTVDVRVSERNTKRNPELKVIPEILAESRRTVSGVDSSSEWKTARSMAHGSRLPFQLSAVVQLPELPAVHTTGSGRVAKDGSLAADDPSSGVLAVT
jgi:hypothetical protein